MERKIRELINWLNNRTIEYNEGSPTVTDTEWDYKYKELEELEKQYPAFIFPDSPTQRSGILNTNLIVDELKKVQHSHPMLSLAKTKDIEEAEHFMKPDLLYVLMAKMDGLTISLYYENGYLKRAETRGDGTTGEDVTHNAYLIKSIPNRINYTNPLTVDGEIICTYKDFEPFAKDYANPRNFAAGSLRLLNAKECAERHLTFVAWDIIEDVEISLSRKFDFLKKIGFIVVPFTPVGEKLDMSIQWIKERAQESSYPIDGFVLKIDRVAPYREAGITAHHPKGALAIKEYDEEAETELLDIEYTMGKTGILSPVAIFKPVELCGSTISRASLHNLSVMEKTLNGKPYKNQHIIIFRANLIIPQVATGTPAPSDNVDFIEVPKNCPYCGNPTEIIKDDVKTVLYCSNNNCNGKLNNIIKHYCSKKGMDIKGIGEKVIDFLIEKEWLKDISDLYELKEYRAEWVKCDGWGNASVNKILNNIEESKICKLPNFIAAIGIPDIGITIAKKICEKVDSYEEFRQLINTNFDFTQWYGFSFETRKKLINFDYSLSDKIYNNYLTILSEKKEEIHNEDLPLAGKKLVITGKLLHFKNRDEAIDVLSKKLGCSVTSTVTKDTYCLINNDKNSTTQKNLKAKSLNIPIYSEEEILNQYNIFFD